MAACAELLSAPCSQLEIAACPQLLSAPCSQLDNAAEPQLDCAVCDQLVRASPLHPPELCPAAAQLDKTAAAQLERSAGLQLLTEPLEIPPKALNRLLSTAAHFSWENELTSPGLVSFSS